MGCLLKRQMNKPDIGTLHNKVFISRGHTYFAENEGILGECALSFQKGTIEGTLILDRRLALRGKGSVPDVCPKCAVIILSREVCPGWGGYVISPRHSLPKGNN